MAGEDINNNIDNKIIEKLEEYLSLFFINDYRFDWGPITIKLLYFSCTCALLEYVKQLIEKHRESIESMVKLMIIASNKRENFKKLVIYEDKETFKKEFLNIVLSKYKLNINEQILFADLGILGTDFRYEDIVKMSVELLLRWIVEEEGSNYKFYVYLFLFVIKYTYKIAYRFLSFSGITNKDLVELYKKFIINSVELADVVVDVFKLRLYESKTVFGYIENKALNICLPIINFHGKIYRGKKYEEFFEKLNIVLSMFYDFENLLAPDSDLGFDLKFFKKAILSKKTKSNEKFISELSTKLDSVINKLKKNSKN